MTKEEKIELGKQQITELEKNIEVLSSSTIEPKEGDFLYSKKDDTIFRVINTDKVVYLCDYYDFVIDELCAEEEWGIEYALVIELLPSDIKIISKEEVMKMVPDKVAKEWFK